MSTLTIMKARIADELARADLTSQIAYAISDAIKAYQGERFMFNESRALTFTTVADQEFYTSSDSANIALINKIDYLGVYVGDIFTRLRPETPANIEAMSQNGSTSGTPISYCYYAKSIRLYPVPATALTVRVGAACKVAEPASDSEADNPWMIEAERLVRSRAKLELALHVLKDADLAQTMNAAVLEAFDDLKSRSNQLMQTEAGRIEPMEF